VEFVMWILFGAMSGWLASLILRTDEEQGLIFDMLIGVIGALVGGFVMNILGTPGTGSFTIYSLVVAILGSVILLAVVRALRTN
jgi:uncharacterized membrane protein YeaQ/YmgE (transglycosylase-associated protein family)